MAKWNGIRVILPLICFSLLARGPSAVAGANTGGIPPGSAAPFFTSNDLSGAPVDLGALVGKSKAVVVNFWGLRCSSCVQEIPHLNNLYAKYKGAGLAVIGVNADGIGADVIKAQLPRLPDQPAYTVVPDEELKVVDLYKMVAAPLTLVLDPAGKVVYNHEGYKPGDEKELEARIESLVR